MSVTTGARLANASKPPGLGPRILLVAIGNEVQKGLRHAWSERLQILIEMPMFVSFSLLFSLLIGQGQHLAATGHLASHLDSYRTTWLFLGFAAFTFAYLQVVKVFWRLLGEIQSGTLEQTYLSPLPTWTHVAVGRVAATIVETGVIVAVMYGVTRAFVDLTFRWQPEALVAVASLILGGAGFSLIVAGLTLIVKRMQIVNDLLLGVIMLVGGAILPLAALPSWVRDLSGPLFFTQSVAGARITLLYGQPLPTWGTGGLVWIAITSLAWLAAGVAVFKVAERVALCQGGLGRY